MRAQTQRRQIKTDIGDVEQVTWLSEMPDFNRFVSIQQTPRNTLVHLPRKYDDFSNAVYMSDFTNVTESQLAERITELESDRNVLLRRVSELERRLNALQNQVVDLSPIGFYRVQNDDVALRFRHPIEVAVALSEDRTLLIGSNVEFGIDAFAHTKGELVSEIHEQILFNWREYAKESDESLSEDARQLKQRLLSAIQEVPVD